MISLKMLLVKILQTSSQGLIAFNTSAASGTTDGNLVVALNALGWLNDVVE